HVVNSTTVTDAIVVGALEVVAGAKRVTAEEGNLLRCVDTPAIGCAFRWLDKADADGGEVASYRVGSIDDIVKVCRRYFCEVVGALAERAAQCPARAKGAVVPYRNIPSAVVEGAVCRRIVDVQRTPRRRIGGRGISEHREVELVIGVDVKIDFGSVVLCVL